jgi:hypothetical protein
MRGIRSMRFGDTCWYPVRRRPRGAYCFLCSMRSLETTSQIVAKVGVEGSNPFARSIRYRKPAVWPVPELASGPLPPSSEPAARSVGRGCGSFGRTSMALRTRFAIGNVTS